MKRLNKTQIAQRDAVIDKMKTARDALEKAFSDAYDAGGTINNAWDLYQAAVQEAASFRDDIVSAMDDYASERSEKWSESDAGQNFESWKSDWEGIELELGELENPDLDEIAPDFGEQLAELPEEAG